MINNYSKINKTEEEITRSWKGSFDNPLVSVVCHIFNHEKYISSALDGFLIQETNFPFEVIVHDDASTDNSVNIIKEYVKNYPNIIKPIYEKTNVYSKHDGSIRKIIFREVKGTYIAMCEGDDCWIDSNKLQIQHDIMETNQDCYLCVHNTIIHDLSAKNRESLFNKWNNYKKLNVNDVFVGWNVHTSSFFMKTSLYEKLIDFPNSSKYYFGDFVLMCLAIYYGTIIYSPKVMSIYNVNNKSGLTYINDHLGSQALINRELLKIQFIEDYNAYTTNKYCFITNDLIVYYKLLCKYYDNKSKEIIYSEEYKNAYKNLPKSLKYRILVSAYFPNLFRFLKDIKNK